MNRIYKGLLLSCTALLLTACGTPSTGSTTTSHTGVASSSTASNTGSTGAASSSASDSAYHKITAEEAKKMMQDDSKAIIIDVRTKEEYDGGHIPGAILLPNETIGTDAPTALPDKNATLLVYCRSGNRSKQASDTLVELGYTKVYDFGGINDWPYETTTDDSAAASSSQASSAQASSSSAQASSDGLLSSFSATTLDDKTADQSILSGKKLTMVNIWATYCSPCIEEMPDLGKLNANNKDKGFQVIGIVSDATDLSGNISKSIVSSAQEIVDKTSATYTHLLPSSDLNSSVMQQVSVVPTTIFVDETGKQVGETYLGSKSLADWQAVVDKLLQQVG